MLHDFNNYSFVTKNETIDLTLRENIILDELLNNKDKVVTVKDIANRLTSVNCKCDSDNIHDRNNIKASIYRLKKKTWKIHKN